ncbi:TolC family protein [bacterium]|nr:TolC family protein [bacterium]
MAMRKYLVIFILSMMIPLAVTAGETMTLDQCMEIALKHNPQLAQSRFSKAIAGKDVIVAFSNFLPSAELGLGYNHSVTGPSTTMWVDPVTGLKKPEQNELEKSWFSSSVFTVSQSLFSGGYNYFNMKNSLAGRRSAKFEFEDTRQQIIYAVKEQYYNLLKAEKLLEVSQESMKSSEETFKLAEARYQVGTAPRSEMLQFKVELENARLALIEAQHNLSIARTSLNQVLGMDMDADTKVVDDLELPEVNVDFEQAVQISSVRHPILLKGKADVDGAKTYIGMAASQYLPRVSLSYRYSWNHQDFNEIKHIRDDNYNWSVGVSLSIPIFTGFSRCAQMGSAILNYKMSREVLNYYTRQVDLRVKQAYFSVQQAKKKISVTEDAEAAADETLRLNKEKYHLGAGTMLDLINAQSSYTEAKSNRIQALYDYKLAVAELKRAMGELSQ